MLTCILRPFAMPSLTVNGIDVFYRDEGAGDPIIFGHCSTATSGQWRHAIERFSDRYRCLAPDHLGYGRSGACDGEGSLIDLEIAVVEALLDRVDGPAHFVGHSFGGAVLIRTAIREQERVRSLTAIEPILFHLLESHGWSSEYEEIRAVAGRAVELARCGDLEDAARGFIDYWSGPGAFDRMPADRRAATIKGMRKVRFEWEIGFEPKGATAEDLAQLDFPIQLVAGANTTRVGSAVTHVLRRVWPSAAYIEVPGAGHMAP
ncbi:MAG TPA: alpha/beta fold hydrolase, partial [Gammaproteobacteria bacterium]